MKYLRSPPYITLLTVAPTTGAGYRTAKKEILQLPPRRNHGLHTYPTPHFLHNSVRAMRRWWDRRKKLSSSRKKSWRSLWLLSGQNRQVRRLMGIGRVNLTSRCGSEHRRYQVPYCLISIRVPKLCWVLIDLRMETLTCGRESLTRSTRVLSR